MSDIRRTQAAGDVPSTESSASRPTEDRRGSGLTLIELPFDRLPFDKLRASRTVLPAMRKCEARGFTLIELLVVIAIIALLVSILMPSLQQAKDLATRAKCGVNLRSIGVATNMYADDNNEWLPFASASYGIGLMGLSTPVSDAGPHRLGLLYATNKLKPGTGGWLLTDYQPDADYVDDTNMFYCPGRTYNLQPIPNPWTPLWDTWLNCNYAGYSQSMPWSAFYHNTWKPIDFKRDVTNPGWPYPDNWNKFIVWVACFRGINLNSPEAPHRDIGVNVVYRDSSVRFVYRPSDAQGGWAGVPGGQGWYDDGNIVDGTPLWTIAADEYGPVENQRPH